MKKNYENLALIRCETIGVYEFKVIGNKLVYFSLYDEGFYKITFDLDSQQERRELIIPWKEGEKIPDAMLNNKGFCIYNYFIG